MGVLFNGSSDYYVRGADLTDSADSKTGIFSAWVRLDGGDASNLTLLATDNLGCTIRRVVTNKFEVRLENAASTIISTFQTANTFTSSAVWYHVLASWDLATTTTHLYIDGVSDKVDTAGPTDDVIDYTSPNWGVGGATGGAAVFKGAFSEFYFAPGEFLDFSVEANRRKFIGADGSPANLGPDGSKPTGTAPIIYLSGGKDAFPINRGTGGSFTAVGTSLTVPFAAPEDTRARSRHRLGADYYR